MAVIKMHHQSEHKIQALEKLSFPGLLASLPASVRAKLTPKILLQDLQRHFTREQLAELDRDWAFWARPDQKAPEGNWAVWLILAGRGWGKTRTGAEWVRQEVEDGRATRIALVGETAADVRDVMVEGPSGILAISPPNDRPLYEPSKRRLTWPNGAIASLYNATEPDQLRGPAHDLAWCDELAKWKYAQETWDQLQFGMRVGRHPRQLVTTTPRPIPLVRAIMKDPQTVITRGRTLDNSANLAEPFLKSVMERYSGTRLGRQELEAEVLDDVPGALWTRAMLDANRIKESEKPNLQRVVVAVDPSGAGGDEDGADDIGIVVAGRGIDGLAYVLADYTCSLSPEGWGRRAVEAYHRHSADRIVAERNFGGAMVEHVIRVADRTVSYKEVTASRGKVVRAEPIAALYEQGRVKHVGALPQLEDQLCAVISTGYVGEGSPDRADALVWAITELMLKPEPGRTLFGSY